MTASKSDVLFVTLARGGSKGVPGKHTRLLGGKPVLAWTIEAVLASKYAGHYAVSSDDDEILDIAREYPLLTVRRPKQLAQDTTPTLPALIHAVQTMEGHYDTRFSIIAEIRATSPFKTTADIDGAIDLLLKNELAESVIGVTPIPEDLHPQRIKWLDLSGYLCDFVDENPSGRRQDCTPKAYVRNGTFYILRREALMGEGGKLFGHRNSLGYVMPPERSINIDTEQDWEKCIGLLK